MRVCKGYVKDMYVKDGRMNRVDVGVCRFGVEISRYISVVSQRDIYVKERYVSRGV